MGLPQVSDPARSFLNPCAVSGCKGSAGDGFDEFDEFDGLNGLVVGLGRVGTGWRRVPDGFATGSFA